MARASNEGALVRADAYSVHPRQGLVWPKAQKSAHGTAGAAGCAHGDRYGYASACNRTQANYRGDQARAKIDERAQRVVRTERGAWAHTKVKPKLKARGDAKGSAGASAKANARAKLKALLS